MKFSVIVLSTFLILTGVFTACDPGEVKEIDEVFARWDTDTTPGAAVAVVRDGSVIFKKGYGNANLEYGIPVHSSTVFHIASVSKQFTVFSVLLLEKDGKLSLDDDIRKYIPEVPDFGKTITLRHLASHTSGLRDQWSLLTLAGWRMDDVITKEHILKLVSRQKGLNFEPGDQYLYCNTGFTLLAEVVARVSGNTFAEFTEEKIFKPLNMVSTLFYDDHEKIVRERAYSYYSDSTGYKKSVLSYANVGATSLFTTVEDLSLWAMNFTDPKVGDIEMINLMNTPVKLNNGEEFGGGLGQFIGKYKGLNEIQHGGADAGYRSYLGRFPDQNFAVVVFSNAASFNSWQIAHQVVDIFLENEFEIDEKENTKEETQTEPSNLDDSLLKRYVGEYEYMKGTILKISTDSGKLFVQDDNQELLHLKAKSDTLFTIIEGVEMSFPSEISDEAEFLRIHQNDQVVTAMRLEPFDKNSVELSGYTGTYYSEELETSYNLMVKEGKLIAVHSRHSDIELTAIKKDAFSGDRWFFSSIEFVRNSDNSISGCKVSSGRVLNLHFDRID